MCQVFLSNIPIFYIITKNLLGYEINQQEASTSTNAIDDEFNNQHSSSDEDESNPDLNCFSDESLDSGSDDENPETTIEFDGMSLQECVRFWALETNQDHRSINMIMRIISAKTSGKLPRDARTLLQTSRQTPQIDHKAGGKYWYRGLRQCLTDFFR